MQKVLGLPHIGRTISTVLVGLFLWLVLGSTSVLAADATEPAGEEKITMSPAVSRLSAEPGEVKTGSFKVINSGETKYSFTVYARPYSVDTEAYSPNYQDTPARSNLYRWVQFDATGGTLEPGESKEISYTIMVPETAEAGGQYGVLFAETVPANTDSQVVVRNKRVGSIVRMSVGGDIRRAGDIDSQSIPWLQTRPPLSSEVVVNNSGNTDFDVSVTMRVTTLFGREVFKVDADYVVYPEKPRLITVNWDGASILGLYKVEQSVALFDGKSSDKSSYVLMIPRWALIVVFMVVLGGGAYVAYRRLR